MDRCEAASLMHLSTFFSLESINVGRSIVDFLFPLAMSWSKLLKLFRMGDELSKMNITKWKEDGRKNVLEISPAAWAVS